VTIKNAVRATAALALAASALSGCSSSGAASGSSAGSLPTVYIEVKNIAFTPSAVTVKVGQTVTWKFDDGGVPHDVVGDGGLKSALMSSGTYSHVFAKAGTYSYVCTVHSSMMHGTVTVR
jgi:plastocyanin